MKLFLAILLIVLVIVGMLETAFGTYSKARFYLSSRLNFSKIDILEKYLIVSLFVVSGLMISELTWGTFSITKNYFTSKYDSITAGTIVESEIVETSGFAQFLPSRSPGRRYVIRYNYWVDDKEYIGSLVNFGSTVEDVFETVGKYPVGRAVTVYYDPSDSNKAVLEKTYLAFEIWFQLFIIFICVPIILVVIIKQADTHD